MREECPYDNYSLYRKYEAEQVAEIERLPICSECHEHIIDDWTYDFDDYLICEKCLEKNHRKWTVDYVE